MCSNVMSRHQQASSHEKSQIFNAADADVIFRSCDRMLFRIHSRNLDVTSGGFPPSEFVKEDEWIDLSEDSSTLELLFQFVYPRPQPRMEGVTFERLAFLAEAAEKYQVYPAMQVCNLYMTKHLREHALDVLKYSSRHNYLELSNQCAPFVTLEIIASEWKSVPPNLLYAWVRFFDSWNERIRKASHTSPPGHKCANWLEYQRKIFSSLSEVTGIKNDDSVAAVIDVPHYASMCCKDDANRWRKAFVDEIRNLPSFTKFL